MGGVLGGVFRPRPDLGLLDLVDKLEKQNAKASIHIKALYQRVPLCHNISAYYLLPYSCQVTK